MCLKLGKDERDTVRYQMAISLRTVVADALVVDMDAVATGVQRN